MTAKTKRFRTGEMVARAGHYRFDGYVDAAGGPLPSDEEMEVSLLAGQPFPPVASTRRDCWWEPVDDAAQAKPDATATARMLQALSGQPD